jgi:WASH complex subunit strumpellin
MLLMLERYLPGPVREQMVVAVMRHQPEASLAKLEAVCKLIRATGYPGHGSSAEKRPKDYPDKFFGRFPIDAALTKAVVQCLQSDDVYKGAEAFPASEHRSTRLATQAGMLFVVLFFAADLLHQSDAAMRELVDKHFNENWIITIHMG